MRLSKHATTRLRSRSIEAFTLRLIKMFGHSYKSADDSEVWLANRRERQEIQRRLKAMLQAFERSDPPYFVEAADGTIITVGYRMRRIRRR